MIVIRNVFIAKPGNASNLAAQMKEAAVAGKLRNTRVLTDVSGEFNRVVLEHEVESLAEFEERLQQYAADEALQAAMKGYTELYQSGYREILRTA